MRGGKDEEWGGGKGERSLTSSIKKKNPTHKQDADIKKATLI